MTPIRRSKKTPEPVEEREYWVAVRIETTGYLRVKGSSEQDVVSKIENGDINPDHEFIFSDIESIQMTGPPALQPMA